MEEVSKPNGEQQESPRNGEEEEHQISNIHFAKKTMSPEWYYLEIKIIFESPLSEFNEYLCKTIILSTVRGMFGLMGSGIDIDILKLDIPSQTAIIRVHKRSTVGVWSSLTLLNQYDEKPCRIEVLRVSPFLTSFSNTSRTFFQS